MCSYFNFYFLSQRKMLDFVFAVDNPLKFHKENIVCNSHHYSAMKYAGAEFIKHLQEGFAAKIYFNTLVEVENKVIKWINFCVYKLIKLYSKWNPVLNINHEIYYLFCI